MNRCLKTKIRIQRRYRQLVSPETRFIAKMYLLLLALFTLQRAVIMLYNGAHLHAIDFTILFHAFLVGSRFDLATSTYLLAPLFLALLGSQHFYHALKWLLPLFIFILLIAESAELAFYQAFESRFNSRVFEALRHPVTMGNMIWHGYPVLVQLLCTITIVILLLPLLKYIRRPLLTSLHVNLTVRDRLGRTMGNTLVVVLMVFALRGGFQHEPLRCRDAFFSDQSIANQLALNGLFSLGRTSWDAFNDKPQTWPSSTPDKTRDDTRQIVHLPQITR